MRASFAEPDLELDIICGEITTCQLPTGSFDLVHVALLLKYVDWTLALSRLAGLISRGGTLRVVLQRPSAVTPAVTPSAFSTLTALESIFHFVDGDALESAAASLGLALCARCNESMSSAKFFDVLHFRRAVGST